MMKVKNFLTYLTIAFILIFLGTTHLYSAARATIEIKDIDELEEYEKNTLSKLTGQKFKTALEDEITLKMTIYGGPGVIMPLGTEYKEAFQGAGMYFTLGMYFNLSAQTSGTFLKNFLISLEFGMVYLRAYSRNTIIQGATTTEQSELDGRLIMIPMYLGILYRFELFDNFFLAPSIAYGFSFNTLTLPSRIDPATGDEGFEGSSFITSFKAGLNIRYFFTKDFSIEGSLGLLSLIEPQTTGETELINFFFFNVWVNYKF